MTGYTECSLIHGTIPTVRTARLIVGFALVTLPLLCNAQEAGTGSLAGSGAIVDPVQEYLRRLDTLANGALPLKQIGFKESARAAWIAEIKRYSERSTELRVRCHDEIRKANRDTIVDRSALCLRSDIQLEISHRRKEREMLEAFRGMDPGVLERAQGAIDTWIDAATSVIDGVDAEVFSTVDTLKQAKRNLHTIYRRPMLTALAETRTAGVETYVHALAFEAANAVRASNDDPLPFLEAAVPCLEEAIDTSSTHACLETLKKAAGHH